MGKTAATVAAPSVEVPPEKATAVALTTPAKAKVPPIKVFVLGTDVSNGGLLTIVVQINSSRKVSELLSAAQQKGCKGTKVINDGQALPSDATLFSCNLQNESFVIVV